MKIECRDRDKKAKVWSAWEVCEGTEGLTRRECEGLVREWMRDDEGDFYWMRIEYRVVEE